MNARSLQGGSARQVFDEALQRPAPEREGFVREACGSDPALQKQVEDLLAAYQAAEQVFPEVPSSESAGDRLGHYKLLERIGEGGFGTVWMAEQDAPLRRKVALKILKWGMDTRQVVARFEAERQALALMDHPHIAHVYDAGATDSGRPYFVMELVRGVPITRYCDEAKLSPRERLELFLHVCEAVQHAHQKGIIHRDLKPSNVLVTLQDGRPIPKVIDFGIAKATSGHLTDKTLFTGFLQIVGTPEYMAPEQAEMTGVDIDTRADVYSLGVLLYELLTGSKPFELSEVVPLGLQELLRRIREVEPEKPSTRISTLGERLMEVCGRRRVHPRAFWKLLHGDLDWIVLRALEKERGRRYPTAESLAADIGRHLKDEPIEAGPPSRVYRMKKLLRRYWVGVSAAAAIVLALGVGTVVSWLGYAEARAQESRATAAAASAKDAAVRAEAERADALLAREAEAKQREKAERELATRKQIFEFMHDMLSEFDPGESDMSVRQVIDRAAKRAESRIGDDPRIEAEIHDILAWNYRRMGLREPAERHARRRLDILQRALGPEAAESLDAMNDLSLVVGDPARAEELVRSVARTRLATLGDRDPLTLQAEGNVAAYLRDQGRLAEAEAMMLDLRRRHDEIGSRTYQWATLTQNLGRVRLDLGRAEEAVAAFEEALPVLEADLDDADSMLFVTLGNLATAKRVLGDLNGAEAILVDALARARAKLGPAHESTVHLVDSLTMVQESRGAFAAAAEEYGRLVDDIREHGNPSGSTLAAVLHHRAGDLLEIGEIAEAERHVRESVAIYASAKYAPSHEVRHTAQAVDRVLKARGATPSERLQLLRPLLERLRDLVPADHHDMIYPLAHVADTLSELGECEEAEALAREAARIAPRRWRKGTPYYEHALNVRLLLGRILAEMERLDEAEQIFAEVHAESGMTGDAASLAGRAAHGLADVAGARGDAELAAGWRACEAAETTPTEH